MISSGLIIAGGLLCLLLTLPFCKTLRGQGKKKQLTQKNEVKIKNPGQAKSKPTWFCRRCRSFSIHRQLCHLLTLPLCKMLRGQGKKI